MKIIGITGSYGKTSVSEILYDYFIKSKVKTSLYCSNGFFINKETRRKDFFKTSMHKDDYIELLRDDKELGVKIAIIEIKVESMLYDLKLDEIEYDLMVMTNYDSLKDTIFQNSEAHFQAYQKLLSKQKNMMINSSVPKDLFTSYKNYNYFGLETSGKLTIDSLAQLLKIVKSKLGNKNFESKLKTYFHLENLLCSIASLEKINMFRLREFKRTIRNIRIRGRMEFVKFKNKKIIIDNKNHDIKSSIDAIVQFHGNYNYKIYLSILPHQYSTYSNEILNEDMIELKKSKWNYLTYDNLDSRLEGLYFDEVQYINGCSLLNYSKNSLELLDQAIRELKKDEILIIFTKRNYRNYRKHLERKNGKI